MRKLDNDPNDLPTMAELERFSDRAGTLMATRAPTHRPRSASDIEAYKRIKALSAQSDEASQTGGCDHD